MKVYCCLTQLRENVRMLFCNCTDHTNTLSLLKLTRCHAFTLTTRLKTAKTGNVTVAHVEVIRGLTAEHFVHFEC
jgi:Na+-transporting NADH:ubiquinone oxidoreductase subunit NqrD